MNTNTYDIRTADVDTLGYRKDTEISFILSRLIAGKHTKKEIEAEFIKTFAGDNVEEQRSKKTTFDVFFSDVKRPIGTYHASRGLKLVISSDRGCISVTTESLRGAQKAIKDGILLKLKGITPKSKPDEHKAILVQHGIAA